MREETVAHLQRLIGFRTVNPPGEELEAALYLKDVLEGEGISVSILQPREGRAAVIATLKGNGEKRPVMLAAHTDVVSVEADKWTTDPFGGEIRDGYVYGRGAIDDKGMLAVNLVTMLLLAREIRETGAVLTRDVIFLATPDEETGGSEGMAWFVEHHADKLQAEYAINEGGRIRIGVDGTKTLLLQVAEKVSHIVTLTARGHAGHAGVPRSDNAILRIGRALSKISDFASDPQHGISPTIFNAGSKYNVLPSEAVVLMNIRTRPTETIDEIVQHLTRLVDDPDVQLTIVERGEDAPPSPEGSEMYNAIATAAKRLYPKISITPYLSNGVTDSARLRRIGVKAYGLLPFALSLEDESRMHGHDERVPVEALEFGTRLIFDTITQLAMPTGAA